MRYLVWILGLFGVAVALAVAAHNSGYVLMVLPPYRIELSLTLFVSISIMFLVLGYFLIRISFGVIQLPAYVRKYRKERAQMKARDNLEAELTAFFEGRYADSENFAKRAMEAGDTSALHPVIAARSAHELREYKKRDAYLNSADGRTGYDSPMRLMTSGKFFLDQRDPQGALNVLHELRDTGVKDHIGALSLELKANQLAGNWEEVLNVLYQLEKRNGIEGILADQVRLQAWLGIINSQKDLKSLSASIKRMPSDLKKRGNIVVAMVQALIGFNNNSKAIQLLTDSLNENWDDKLVELYGDCISEDAVNQIDQAERWLSDHRQDAKLLLALGKLCLHQKLWGRARNYLDASNSITPSKTAYTALAELAELQGNDKEASSFYQRAMNLAN